MYKRPELTKRQATWVLTPARKLAREERFAIFVLSGAIATFKCLPNNVVCYYWVQYMQYEMTKRIRAIKNAQAARMEANKLKGRKSK